MNRHLEVVRKTRSAILALITDMSDDEINLVPPGFNNNIIWNMAHLIAAQDNIFYIKSGHPLKNIDEEYFENYKPGSKPERTVSRAEIDQIKSLLFSSLEELEKDLKSEIFSDYPAWTTRYGVDIQNVNDGLILLPFHEGLHFGYILAQKRVIRGLKTEV